MKTPTRRQLEVYRFIMDYIKNHSFPPTFRDVAGHFDISIKAAYDHIKALVNKKLIRYQRGQSRTIEIIDSSLNSDEEYIQVPVLGHVAAGNPIFSEENYEYSLSLPTTLLGTGEHFALKVEGDSMIGASIEDGDIAVFAKQNTAIDGQIVVARVEEAFTLKRFYKEKNRVRLQPENPNYLSIFKTNIQILGRLITLIRQY